MDFSSYFLGIAEIKQKRGGERWCGKGMRDKTGVRLHKKQPRFVCDWFYKNRENNVSIGQIIDHVTQRYRASCFPCKGHIPMLLHRGGF